MAVNPNPTRNLVRFPEHIPNADRNNGVRYGAINYFNDSYGPWQAANGNTDTGSGAGGISWAMNVQNQLGWWQCDWAIPQTIDRIILFDRGDGTAFFGSAGTITFSDGSSESFSGLTNGGSLTINFTARRVSWFRVTATAGAFGYAGLSEVEAYNVAATTSLGAGSQQDGLGSTASTVLPAGAVGDIMLAAVGVKSVGTDPSPPAGWDLVIPSGLVSSGGFDTCRLVTLARVADGTEGDSFSITLPSSTKWAVILTRIPKTLVSRVGASTNNVSSLNTVSATPTALDTAAPLLALVAMSNSASSSAYWSGQPAGWTRHGERASINELASTNVGLGLWLKSHPGGSTGTPTPVYTLGDAKGAQLIALALVGGPRAQVVIV